MEHSSNNKKSIVLYAIISMALILLAGCSSSPQQAPVPVVPTPVCEPEIVIKEREVVVDRLGEDVKRKLAMAMEAHRSRYYDVSRESYESVLADGAGLQSDSFALWGLITLFLDRDYSEYSRDNAETVLAVLDHKLQKATEPAAGDVRATEEARLLLAAMKVLFDADVAKDGVVAENRRLRSELANRDEAISRLRELTVGQE